jgi:hypothetical protein
MEDMVQSVDIQSFNKLWERQLLNFIRLQI